MSIVDLDTDARLHRLDTLAHWMDDRFRVPGTSFHVGLDGLLGLAPVLGDLIGLGVSLHILASARRLGAPASLLRRMGATIALDTLVGCLPLGGDLFDFAYKANRRNVTLLKRHLEQEMRRDRIAISGLSMRKSPALG
ncbi:MAG: DUF4112 domain-containing protein [Rhodospirillum sp.]|nr:DUF4112 domain-containing protein [Rhodospirillum sp.]MCF8491094.1 DUF4112 domain-containing protein [Rhodospirillum sp.]MCF8501961.1 DUF4112 domain-containing protein [Rhodospirillum sp.]